MSGRTPGEVASDTVRRLNARADYIAKLATIHGLPIPRQWEEDFDAGWLARDEQVQQFRAALTAEREETGFWQRRDEATAAALANALGVPVVADTTESALAGYVDALAKELAAERERREKAVKGAQHWQEVAETEHGQRLAAERTVLALRALLIEANRVLVEADIYPDLGRPDENFPDYIYGLHCRIDDVVSATDADAPLVEALKESYEVLADVDCYTCLDWGDKKNCPDCNGSGIRKDAQEMRARLAPYLTEDAP